jgi:hypothetical protein
LTSATVNLTQFSSPAELTGALAGAVMDAAAEDCVPVVFFDEFDTTRDGAPYGWLSSFLAPMHDGEFIHDGKNVKLKRAVYVFAGGTASTMEEFTSRQGELEFRRAKGPDFISRLRGSLDVRGPNENPRMWRRALILRHELAERVKRHGSGKFCLDRQLLEAFLRAGRYRHGARSIAALIELADLETEKPAELETENAELKTGKLGWKLLPNDQIVELQVNRGRLDAKTVGGSIALSGFGPPRKSDQAKDEAHLMGECWTCVAKGLWTEGATLAFAGRWGDRGASPLVKLLLDELSSWSQELSNNECTRRQPACRFRSFARGIDPDRSRRDVDEILSPESRQKMGVDLVVQAYLDEMGRKRLARACP